MANDNTTRDDAEFWEMAAAAVTGTRPDLGDNRKVAL